MSEAALRRFFDEAWNAHRVDRFPEFVSPDVVYHPARGEAKGYAGYTEMARAFIASFPDLRFDIEDAIERDGLVGVRLRITGTHRGVWRGRAPTGRRIDVQGRPWLRFRDGKVAEVWALWDEAGAMEQLDSPS